MGLPLSPDLIAGAYEFLRLTPPFRGWRLPHADDVEFVVSRHRTHVAYHRGLRRKVRSHEIGISEVCVGHTDTLLRAMAHEMIHQYQQRARSETPPHRAQCGVPPVGAAGLPLSRLGREGVFVEAICFGAAPLTVMARECGPPR